MRVDKKLRYFRKRANISGKYLAEKADLVPSQIYKIESNTTKPSLDSLERICTVLGITLSEFFAAGTQEASELPPEVRRVCDKVAKLPREKLKILESVLDTWVDDD